MDLSKAELSRYARHLTLPQVGLEGQKKLKGAKILVVGAGGLGSPTLLYLAAAGIGTIGIIDFDIIDESNLQRQVIYSTKDIGKGKAEKAKERILELNPHIWVNTYQERLSCANALQILKKYDVIIDGSDNFPTRYVINDACVMLKKPFVYGAIHQFIGHASVFNLESGPCYRCLFPNPPSADLVPNCTEAGVLGILPGIIGTIQATEAIKIVLEKEDTLCGRFLIFDAMKMHFSELKLKKNPKCPICSENPTITELLDYDIACAAEPIDAKKDSMTVSELKKLMDTNKKPMILDVREDFEREICKLEDDLFFPFHKIQANDLSFLKEIKKDEHVVIYCHTGRRSGIVSKEMRAQGYRAINLEGGIEAWAEKIDPLMQRY